MDGAVIGMLENREATLRFHRHVILFIVFSFCRVLDMWFPWITRSLFMDEEGQLLFSDFSKERQRVLLDVHEYNNIQTTENGTRVSLSAKLKAKMLPSSLEKVRKYNECDLKLFEKGKRLFRKQLQFIVGNDIEMKKGA